MSAFYAVAYHDKVELLTDGAVYTDDGNLVEIRKKVWTSEHTPIAVTGRGDSRVVAGFASAFMCLAVCGSFDATIVAVQDMLDRRREKGAPSDVEMVICGISETGGPRIAYFVTRDIHDLGIKPWQIFDWGSEIGGGIQLAPEDLAGMGDASNSLLDVAVPFFDAMRRKKGTSPMRPDLPEIHGIGGHIDWTVITADGCAVERIHEWPDVVGEKIEPARTGWDPAALSAMG